MNARPTAPVVPTGAAGERANETRRVRRQRLVPTAGPRRRAHGALLFSLACALSAAVGLLAVFQTSTIAELGVELSAVQRDIEAQSLRNAEMSFQLGYYESLPVVEELAIERQGMQPMDASYYLTAQRPPEATATLVTHDQQARRSVVQRMVDRLLGRGEARAGEGGGE